MTGGTLSDITAAVILHAERDRPLRNRHPWVFSGAVAEIRGTPASGDLVDILSGSGEFLGRGMAAPGAAIRARVLAFEPVAIDAGFIGERIRRAAGYRSGLPEMETTAYRVVNGEGDGLPGLIVDRYQGYIVCQFTAAGMERRREWIYDALEEVFDPLGIYVRAVRDVRESEGLTVRDGPARGECVPPRVEVAENGLCYLVDIAQGQKTGFYLDQRENRAWIRRLAQGRRVLNCHAYTGGFTVSALCGGAESAVSLDRSRSALELARENVARNRPDAGGCEFAVADAPEWLRAAEAGRFDLMVLDPPALAKNKATLGPATRAYKELNRQAFRIVAPGGLLLTCSCSRPLDRGLFHKIVFGAALDAGREVQIVGESGHPMDHPVSVYHPEGEYLKAVLLRAL